MNQRDLGSIVKQYRKKMTYNVNGIEKCWTQTDLARMLDVSVRTVKYMETKNKGLDSMERRQALATLLKIPPMLLGLGSLDDIVQVVTGNNTGIIVPEKPLDIPYAQKSLAVYNDLFAFGKTYNMIGAIESQISQLVDYVRTIPNRDNLRLLWEYKILASKVHGSDFLAYEKAMSHLNDAIEIAMELEDRELMSVSLYTCGVYHLRRGQIGLAKVAIDGALRYAPHSLPQTHGAIISLNAFYHVEREPASQLSIQRLTEEAGKYAGMPSDVKTLKFGRGSYMLHCAEAYQGMHRPGKALELLDSAERLINPDKRRLLSHVAILRARCYIDMKHPEYEQAVFILQDALHENRTLRIERNIHHIRKIYKELAVSNYGQSPDVVELGMALR